MTTPTTDDVTVLVQGVRAGSDPARTESLETELRQAAGRSL